MFICIHQIIFIGYIFVLILVFRPVLQLTTIILPKSVLLFQLFVAYIFLLIFVSYTISSAFTISK